MSGDTEPLREAPTASTGNPNPKAFPLPGCPTHRIRRHLLILKLFSEEVKVTREVLSGQGRETWLHPAQTKKKGIRSSGWQASRPASTGDSEVNRALSEVWLLVGRKGKEDLPCICFR